MFGHVYYRVGAILKGWRFAWLIFSPINHRISVVSQLVSPGSESDHRQALIKTWIAVLVMLFLFVGFCKI